MDETFPDEMQEGVNDRNENKTGDYDEKNEDETTDYDSTTSDKGKGVMNERGGKDVDG